MYEKIVLKDSIDRFNSVGKGKGRGVDCKIFWEQTLASFLEGNFGLQFAVPRGIWRIRQITAEICRI